MKDAFRRAALLATDRGGRCLSPELQKIIGTPKQTGALWRIRCTWTGNEDALLPGVLTVIRYADEAARDAAFAWDYQFGSETYDCQTDVLDCNAGWRCKAHPDAQDESDAAMALPVPVEGHWPPEPEAEGRYFYTTQGGEDPNGLFEPGSCHRFITWTIDRQGAHLLAILSSRAIVGASPSMSELLEFWYEEARYPLGVADPDDQRSYAELAD